MLHDATTLVESGPVAIRYPRGAARQVAESEVGSGLSARKVATGSGTCIIAIGKMLEVAEKAAEELAADGIEVTVWDARCCAPLDAQMIADAATHDRVITIEDGIRDGGIGMTIADQVHEITREVPVEVLGLPSKFIPQGKPDRILAQLGLDAEGIAAAVHRRLG